LRGYAKNPKIFIAVRNSQCSRKLRTAIQNRTELEEGALENSLRSAGRGSAQIGFVPECRGAREKERCPDLVVAAVSIIDNEPN
jgi:hypothetical protein